MPSKLIDFFYKLLRLVGLSTARQKRGDVAKPESHSDESLVEIATRTYDALPKIAEAFLQHAANAGFATKELGGHLHFTFESATIVFSYCDPKCTLSRAIRFKSRERDFQLWFEVRGAASLNYGEPRESRPICWQEGYEFKGDVKAFIEAAEFVSSLSPKAFGLPSKIE